MGQYLPIVALAVLAVLFGAVSILASRLLNKPRPTPAKTAPYECGIVDQTPPPERLIEKTTFDSTRAPGFLERLPADHTLVVTGCEAHICVLQTVLGLIDAGRRVYVVADAVGSRKAQSKRVALRRMAQASHHRHNRDGSVRMGRRCAPPALQGNFGAGEVSGAQPQSSISS